jgi:hypothetical protein
MPRKSDPARPTHPGRTPAERRALDRIGCGEPPACSRRILHNLLKAGLIVETVRKVRRDVLGRYDMPVYAMPIPVHMQWCSAVAANDEETAGLEGLL